MFCFHKQKLKLGMKLGFFMSGNGLPFSRKQQDLILMVQHNIIEAANYQWRLEYSIWVKWRHMGSITKYLDFKGWNAISCHVEKCNFTSLNFKRWPHFFQRKKIQMNWDWDFNINITGIYCYKLIWFTYIVLWTGKTVVMVHWSMSKSCSQM